MLRKPKKGLDAYASSKALDNKSSLQKLVADNSCIRVSRSAKS